MKSFWDSHGNRLVNLSFFFLSLRKIGKKNFFFCQIPCRISWQPSLPTSVSLSVIPTKLANHGNFYINCFLTKFAHRTQIRVKMATETWIPLANNETAYESEVYHNYGLKRVNFQCSYKKKQYVVYINIESGCILLF